MRNLVSAILVLAIFALSAVACKSSSTFNGECKRDSDCSDYERCDTRDYRCVCSQDEACAQGEFCNASGSCQRKMECFSNADCSEGSVCDILSGECISSSGCRADFQCDIGQICEGEVCRIGCRETSDCDLANREVCIDGDCRFGLCENNSYCEFGRVCNTEDNSCVLPEEPHCVEGCSHICEQCGEDTEIGPCGDPANVCVREGDETHCWVYCEEDDECPSGYQCVPTTVSWSPICDDLNDCTEAPDPNDRVVNVCDGNDGGTIGRCRLNKQPCWNDEDCYPFETECFAGQCIFAYHCRPSGGCQ